MRNPSSSSSSTTTSRGSATTNSTTATPCCSKVGIKRGPWTPEEDQVLASYIRKEGEGRWRTLPKRAGLLRCGKSCRLRWMNYLRPSVKRGRIAPDEEDLILRLHRLLGNRWSLIAGRIPGRTDNEIKNYWNTHLSKKLINQGIDPRTHKPLNPNPTSSSEAAAAQPNQASNPKPFPFNPEPATTTHPPDRFQGQQVDAGGVNWPNSPCLNVGEAFVATNNGNSEDTFSSFLDSLINIDSLLVNHQPQQMASPSLEPVPVASSAQHFSVHNTIWEAEAMSSFAGLGCLEDGPHLNNHPAA